MSTSRYSNEFIVHEIRINSLSGYNEELHILTKNEIRFKKYLYTSVCETLLRIM